MNLILAFFDRVSEALGNSNFRANPALIPIRVELTPQEKMAHAMAMARLRDREGRH